MPPMPRGSLRCFRKKYSSHQRLEARVLVGAERRERVAAGAVEVDARLPRSRSTASGPCRRRTRPPARAPAGSAASMRTFMCTVGTYGLRGWNTSETPIASNGAPASSGRCCVADGGSARPLHVREAAAAALEQRAAFEQARDAVALELAAGLALPGVADEGVAALGLDRRDDALLQAEQVVADGGGVRSSDAPAASTLDRALADVAAVLRAVEADAAQRPRRRAAAPARVESPSAVTHSTRPPAVTRLAVAQRGAGVEHHRRRSLSAGRPVIASPLRGVSRIAGRGHHDAERDAPVPLQLDLVERAVGRRAMQHARTGRSSGASGSAASRGRPCGS